MYILELNIKRMNQEDIIRLIDDISLTVLGDERTQYSELRTLDKAFLLSPYKATYRDAVATLLRSPYKKSSAATVEEWEAGPSGYGLEFSIQAYGLANTLTALIGEESLTGSQKWQILADIKDIICQ